MDIPAWQAAEAASTAATVIMNIFMLAVRTRGSWRGWSHVARVSAGLAAPGPARGYMLAGLEIPGSGRNPRGHSSPAELSLGLTAPSLPHQHTTKYDAVSSTGDLEQSFPSPSHKIPNHKMQRLLCLCLLFSRCPLTADWRIWRWDYCVFVLSAMCPGAGHGGCRSNWISYLCDHHHETTDNWSPRGDKKLCVFQNRQSVDFTDYYERDIMYFVAVHIILAILQGICSSVV